MTRTSKNALAAMGCAALVLAGSACARTAARRTTGGPSADSSASAASRAEAPPSAASSTESSTGAKEIRGRVELIDRANNVTLAGSESAGLAFQKLKVDSGTVVIKEGAEASTADISEGDEVRASLSGSGDDLRVEKIEILPSDTR